MQRRIVFILLLVFLPVLVWGWENDVVIDILRRSNNQFPVSYDITWRDSTDMLAAIGFNSYTASDTSSYIYLYNSNDRGNTWNQVATAQWNGAIISGIQLLESPPYLIALWQEQGRRIALTVHNRDNLSYYSSATMTEADSIVDARIVSIQRGSTKNIYIGIVTRNTTSNTDILKIYKSVNYSQFQQILAQYFTNNSNFLFLKDMDAVLNQDTIILYLTLENLNRSNNKASLSFRIIKEDTSGNLTNTPTGYPIEYASPLNSSLGVSGPYALTLLQTDNDLKYVFASNYFASISLYTFPYNTTDSTEWGPFVKGWISNGNHGFHIIFSRGNITSESKLYYVEATASGNSIQFSAPVLVSDEILVCKDPFRSQSHLYNPRIATLREEYTPAVIWPQDFWHLVYATPWYDSTYFAVDRMDAVTIHENVTPSNKLFTLSVKRGNVCLNFDENTPKVYKGEIMNIEGKIIKAFNVPAGSRKFNVEVSNFRKGAYFISLEDDNTLLKVEKFLIW